MCLPLCRPESCQSRYVLTLTESRLELGVNPVMAADTAFSPLFVDFLGGGVAYRHLHNCTTRQPLARAVGIKPGFRPDVFDATAGLGGDGFVLACLGCQVILNERSGIVAALLADGMERAAMEPRTAETINSRMRLLVGDARDNLRLLAPPPYTIYLDPMYPHSPKSALNKKEMRMIRDIVGDDPDSGELLQVSLSHAVNRVVVKRPKGAEHLGDRAPSHEILMKNSRFDVYLINHL